MSVLQLDGSSTVAWTDVPADATDAIVVLGRDDAGAGAIQVGVARLTARPTKGVLDNLWKSRGTRAPMGFIVAAVTSDGVWLHYPSTDAPTIGPVTVGQAERQLQSVLDEGNGLAAHARFRAIQEAMSSAGTDGFSNHFLFATYHLNRDVPRRPDWESAGQKASPLLPKRGIELVSALGFEAEPAGSERLLVLRTAGGPRRSVAVLLRDDEQFDQKSATYQLTPVAKALEIAGREDVPWVIALRKGTLRLYPGRDGVGVGQRGQSETFFELDLDLLAPEQAALLTLIFSAEALDANGSAQQILEGSGKYAADLGTRLRDRVYEGVVPRVALALADQMPALGLTLDVNGLQTAYRLTMRILFRLLFQAYGEATELLPAGRNDNYDANSLQAFISREIGTRPEQFSTESAAIWSDLMQVWEVIFHGNSRWEVPAYGGSLFDPATEEGALLSRLKLTDSVIGPALQELLSEITVDQTRGPVDFRSLQVREFGTIYEGLLESSLSLAEQNLTVDRKGVYVPAKDDDVIVAPAGRPYFHSASGERKATGSYYTPKIVVDHLIERSVRPALEAHLARVKSFMDEGKERQAADAFFDFRVADLAMGSAHFLVAAVDKIERGMRDFLTATEVPGVRAELARLADKAREALGQDTDGAKAITDGQLLRRQVARRCIYGLDINPLAVELSQLALWIHTFVPGLPMSSLEHGLVLANSLTGIGTIDEAMDALKADGLFEQIIREPLTAARDLLIEYANASEADKSEVAAGAEMLAKARDAAAPAKAIFDVAVAKRLGVTVDEAWDAEQFKALAAMREVRDAVDPLQSAHMPYLFPEVFLRDRPGFDVLVGNPPWDKVRHEPQQFWVVRDPGLNTLTAEARKERIEWLRSNRPLDSRIEAKSIELSERQTAYFAASYALQKSQHYDYAKLFAERNLVLVREGGEAGFVLPQALLVLGGWAPIRIAMLEHHLAEVAPIRNTNGWAFPNVHGQMTIALVVLGPGSGVAVRAAASSAEALSSKAPPLTLSVSELSELSEELNVPWFEHTEDPEVFSRLARYPRLGGGSGWVVGHADSTRWDFSSSGKHAALAKTSATNPADWRITMTRHVDRWFMSPTAEGKWIDEVERLASLKNGVVKEGGRVVVSVDHPPLVYRFPTNNDNSRTLVAAALPAEGWLNSKGYAHGVRLDKDVSTRDVLALLGYLNSVPADWWARRFVDRHLGKRIIEGLPLPAWDESDRAHVAELVASILGSGSVVEIAGPRIVPVVAAPVARAEAEAEINALALTGLGLGRAEALAIFDDFSDSVAALPASAREAILHKIGSIGVDHD